MQNREKFYIFIHYLIGVCIWVKVLGQQICHFNFNIFGTNVRLPFRVVVIKWFYLSYWRNQPESGLISVHLMFKGGCLSAQLPWNKTKESLIFEPRRSGSLFNLKTVFAGMDSDYKDMTVVTPSYANDRNSSTSKTVHLYWDGPPFSIHPMATLDVSEHGLIRSCLDMPYIFTYQIFLQWVCLYW